jgi:hypothetical protein
MIVLFKYLNHFKLFPRENLRTNIEPSLKSKHKVEYEYVHAYHNEMVCLIVMIARSCTLINLTVQASRILII